MRRPYWALFVVFVPVKGLAQESHSLPIRVQLDRSYVHLFDVSGSEYSRRDLKSMRSVIEQERKEQIDACGKDRDGFRTQLKSQRNDLKKLNESAPRDTSVMAALRNNAHLEISALETVLRDKTAECEHAIPAEFEIQLAKLRVLDQWPRRREQTDSVIEAGRARDRKHGDVDDIGYRKLTEDQEKDVRVGEQAVRQMQSGGLMPKEIQDPAIRDYVQHLAQKIASHSDLKVPVHVVVLDSADVSSVGLPGGFLFVTSSLLLACETESELAGVMSQQIAHIAARHGTRASKRSLIAKMFVPAAQVATGFLTGGVSSAGAYYGMGYGFQGLGLLVDRTLVPSGGNTQKEADQLGIQYAWNAGFDPKGFVAFLDSLAKTRDYARTGAFFSTNPALGKRVIDAFAEVRYLPARDHDIVDSEDFRNVKERLVH